MKMVSQLTRQAMSRHRAAALRTPAAVPRTAPAAPAPDSVQPLYTPPAASIPTERPSAVPQPRPKTIYQQLMVSHDRMRERHVHRT